METTETLTDLLEQWSELEPGKCRIDMVWIGSKFVHLDPRRSIEEVQIQAAVQQALMERDWAWVVGDDFTFDDGICALITTSGGTIGVGDADCPAHALLSAYVQTLHAVRDQAGD